MLEHPERIDSIGLNNPLSHDYATLYPRSPSGTKLLESYFRRVSADYRIEEVETSQAPEKTLVRVLSRKHGTERAQFQFGRDTSGWHMESRVISHPQFVNAW